MRLTGDAWLTDGQNEIRGNTLVYDIGRERVQANPNEKDPGGVQITINPPKKAPVTRPTGAAPATAARQGGGHDDEPAARRGTRQELSFAAGGQGPVARGRLRRGRRPARAERRRQDHRLLHDRRPGAVRRGTHPPRRPGADAPADVPPRPAGRRLPAAGSVGLPQAVGRGQHPGDPRDARRPRRRRGAPCRARVAARGVAHRPHPRRAAA